MAPNLRGRSSLRYRAGELREAVLASFGFFTAIAMSLGVLLGLGLPSLDAALGINVPTVAFETQDAGRSLLQTVATSAVSVAGLAFSVTLVAFTLASTQMSPRVLRTFRTDRLIQATLACFLGTFVYCLAVLVRLGTAAPGQEVPNLSITVAVVLAIASFGLFAGFIAHIVSMLQPASIIGGILETGKGPMARRFPTGIGREPDDADAASRAVDARLASESAAPVRAEREGHVTSIRADEIVHAASECGALVVQRTRVGDYVTPGMVMAEIVGDGDEEFPAVVHDAFELGRQRTPVNDAAFSIRQLADIALKGMSPGINDPTTAENAINAMTSLLVRAAATPQPSRLRCDDTGEVRFVALSDDLDDLVRLGFEQVRVFAAPYPVVSRRLIELLSRIDDTARRNGVDVAETSRQAELITQTPEGEVPTGEDVASVERTHERHFGPTVSS